jgi:hypothetical protein
MMARGLGGTPLMRSRCPVEGLQNGLHAGHLQDDGDLLVELNELRPAYGYRLLNVLLLRSSTD